mmetsp:Transcript_49074/g.140831  ORF Transcript_49074/g.140831 Transcript_49074/m.140831 type:complete len:241 (-) Transcript_49074:44-766(-)
MGSCGWIVGFVLARKERVEAHARGLQRGGQRLLQELGVAARRPAAGHDGGDHQPPVVRSMLQLGAAAFGWSPLARRRGPARDHEPSGTATRHGRPPRSLLDAASGRPGPALAGAARSCCSAAGGCKSRARGTGREGGGGLRSSPVGRCIASPSAVAGGFGSLCRPPPRRPHGGGAHAVSQQRRRAGRCGPRRAAGWSEFSPPRCSLGVCQHLILGFRPLGFGRGRRHCQQHRRPSVRGRS